MRGYEVKIDVPGVTAVVIAEVQGDQSSDAVKLAAAEKLGAAFDNFTIGHSWDIGGVGPPLGPDDGPVGG